MTSKTPKTVPQPTTGFRKAVIGGSLLILLAPWVAGAAAESAKASPAKPNIVYICTDQQFAEAMSCAGNPYVKTPMMDSLAATGTRFTEAYTASPLCTPARGSMLTGLYPHENGVTTIGIAGRTKPIRPERAVNSIEHLMKRQGYETVYAGKWHVVDASGLHPAEMKQHPYDRVLCGQASDQQVGQACATYLAEKHDRPFFLIASFTNPHDICKFPIDVEKDKVLFVDNPPPLPSNFGIPEEEPSIMRQRYIGYLEAGRMSGRIITEKKLWPQYLAAYYGYVEKVDAGIGLILNALKRAGVEKNTLIIFSSDHGDGMGSHQWLQKCCHYEESVRVPFIVSLPGVTKAGAVDSTHLVASCQDFYATALDYAGAEIPTDCSGRSVRSLAEGRSVNSWRDQVITEICVMAPAGQNNFGRMVRTGRFKYALYDEGEKREALFDLQNDRGEMHDLVNSPEHQSVLAEHRQRLAAWCQATKDDAFANDPLLSKGK